MTDLAQADIFFFVTTMAVIAITIVIVIAVYHVIKVVQQIQRIVRTAQREVDKLVVARRQASIYALTTQKFIQSLMRGGLFRQKRRDQQNN